LRLTDAERVQLCITTIRSHDATAKSMAENAKRKDREYQKAKRDENRTGRHRGRPKSEGVPAWVAAGASSKATCYRNPKAGKSETENASGALEGESYAADGIGGVGAFDSAYGLARTSAFTYRRRLRESWVHSRRRSGPTHRGSAFR
jgi:hypothetical protein